MIHTMTITYRILSIKLYTEVYENLQHISIDKKLNLYKRNRSYVTHALKEYGFSEIALEKINVNSKYKHDFIQIKIKLNPAKLLGKKDIGLIYEMDIETLYEVFDMYIKMIHNDLPRLEKWTMNRVDYAINIYTPYVKEYIKLFQRADIPWRFQEQYCYKNKRRKQLQGSFYIFSKGVGINFYDKNDERIKAGFYIDEARNLLRLEIQCKKAKVNSMKIKYGFDLNNVENFMKEEICLEIIKYYYEKTIGTGDYYTLSDAIKKVNDSNYTENIKWKLIEVLKEISIHRSIWKARKQSRHSFRVFNKYLKIIRGMNINPVTIPLRYQLNKVNNILLI